MKDIEHKRTASVTTIWSDVCVDGEPAKISIVKGRAIIRMHGFDSAVSGVFDDCDIDGVIAAYKKDIEEINAAFDALPEGWVPAPSDPSSGPIEQIGDMHGAKTDEEMPYGPSLGKVWHRD